MIQFRKTLYNSIIQLFFHLIISQIFDINHTPNLINISLDSTLDMVTIKELSTRVYAKEPSNNFTLVKREK